MKGGEFFLVFFLGRIKFGNRTNNMLQRARKKKLVFHTDEKSLPVNQ
jgi:hypothetical protein